MQRPHVAELSLTVIEIVGGSVSEVNRRRSCVVLMEVDDDAENTCWSRLTEVSWRSCWYLYLTGSEVHSRKDSVTWPTVGNLAFQKWRVT